MALSNLLLGIFCFLLISAAVSNIVTYTIPNWLNGAMFALFLSFVLAVSTEGHAIAWSVLGAIFLAARSPSLPELRCLQRAGSAAVTQNSSRSPDFGGASARCCIMRLLSA